MNKTGLTRINYILCWMMFALLLSSMGLSTMFIGNFIILPFIESEQIRATWYFTEYSLLTITICLTVFWLAYALAERFGWLDKIESRFSKNQN